jgi:hypothetical protein
MIANNYFQKKEKEIPLDVRIIQLNQSHIISFKNSIFAGRAD